MSDAGFHARLLNDRRDLIGEVGHVSVAGCLEGELFLMDHICIAPIEFVYQMRLLFWGTVCGETGRIQKSYPGRGVVSPTIKD